MLTADREHALERWFRSRFGPAGELGVARAPGRVTLAGEHLDYNGLDVMPLPITRGVTLMFSPRTDDRLRLVNAEDRHRPIDCSLRDGASAAERGSWADLVRAACAGLAGLRPVLRGFDGVVESDLPAAAGLSSSTALVVAVARALVTVNRIDVDPLVLIERLAAAERGVGAPGGAMDQAACVAGRPRVALKVAFEPLALAERPIPGNWRFVIAHSLVTADKAGSAERACRARIAECQEALAALQRMGVLGSSSYRNLLARYGGNDLLELSHRLDPVIGRRFRHVVSESLRVDEADRAVRHGMTIEFGRGMTASHASLRDDFAVSHPCLDRLIELSLSNGAVGAKLTGAGFGGCIVALTDGPADVLVEALTREFYDTVPGRPRIEHLVFVE